MLRNVTLIGTAAVIVLSASAASALPFAPPRTAPEAAPLAEPVHYRKARKFRGHHPHVVYRRHSRPSFSFSLNFGTPVVRHYPYYYQRGPYYQYYPYPHYTYSYPSHYGWPYTRRSGVYFGW